MSQFSPSIIVDDHGLIFADAPQLFEYSSSWSLLSTSLNFNNSTELSNGNQSVPATVNLTFTGTSASIFGFYSCLPDVTECPYRAILDGQTSVLRPPSTTILYQSPTDLPDAQHQLSLVIGFNQSSFDAAVDYALVQPGPNTVMNGAVGGFPDRSGPPQDLYVDHNNTAILFKGSWKPSSDGVYRETATIGDSAKFAFYGDVISLIGFLHSTIGSLTLNVSLDNRNPFTVNNPSNPSDNIPFYPYFNEQLTSDFGFPDANHSTEQNHTITVTLADISGTQTFSLLGFIFSPNFKTLSSMPPLPNLSSTPTTTTTTSSTQNSGSTAAVAHDSGGIKAGAIAGVVIGSLLGVALIVVGFLFWMRRRRSKKLEEQARSSISPFTVPERTSKEHTEPSQAQFSPSTISPYMKTADGFQLPPGAAPPQMYTAESSSHISPYTKTYTPESVDGHPAVFHSKSPLASEQQQHIPSSSTPVYTPHTQRSAHLTDTSPDDPPPPLSPRSYHDHETETVVPSEDGRRYPTRRRMMQMIERLNFQVQALSSATERPPAYDS